MKSKSSDFRTRKVIPAPTARRLLGNVPQRPLSERRWNRLIARGIIEIEESPGGRPQTSLDCIERAHSVL